jgi:hypothetical protein
MYVIEGLAQEHGVQLQRAKKVYDLDLIYPANRAAV